MRRYEVDNSIKNKFKILYDNDRDMTERFINYMCIQIGISGSDEDEIMDLIRNGASDSAIFQKIRNSDKKPIRHTYRHTWMRYLPSNFHPKACLDVGTEYEDFFDGIKLKWGNDTIVQGINVQGNNYRDTDVGKGIIRVYDGKKIGFDENTFDLVTCLQVLHHVKDLENVRVLIDEMIRVTKPGGLIVIKEHDIINTLTRIFVDIEHQIYDVVEGDQLGEITVPLTRRDIVGMFRKVKANLVGGHYPEQMRFNFHRVYVAVFKVNKK